MDIPCKTMSSPPTPALRCEYTTQPADQLLASEHALAVFTFNGTTETSNDPRLTHTGLKQVSDKPSVQEVWYSNQPVNYGCAESVNWAQSGEYLYCSLLLEERADTSLAEASMQAYNTLLHFISNKGFPHILRAWNYFSAINEGVDDAERYKEFCLGRHDAFQKIAEKDLSLILPAACAIGHDAQNGCVYLLAAKNAGTNFENPEQISAYHYPRDYGPRSPSFARATLAKMTTGSCLYVSGTASIKGHTTISPGNANEQLLVTLDNIDRLLTHIAKTAKLQITPKMNIVKVYIRRAEYFELLRHTVNAHFNEAQIVFLESDICRKELEVEIDGACYLP